MSPPPANLSQLQQANALLAESPREAEQLLLSILQSKPGAPASSLHLRRRRADVKRLARMMCSKS
jgi:hypothetical protein